MIKKFFAPQEDIADAKKVRQTVFVEEQKFDATAEFDEIDTTAHHVVLYKEEGVPVATGRFFVEEDPNCYHLGRIAVLKEYRKMGLGSILVTAMMEKGAELGATSFCLGAQRQAQGFYETLGFVVCGDEYMDEHTPHVPMRKEI